MQANGGDAAAAPQENAKRMRRPSVRLHQPYYENPGYRKLQQQWNPKKGATPPRKPRTAKTAHSKHIKNGVANERAKSEGRGGFDLDDDVAIGNWRNFSATNGDIDFKRKRVRSSNSKNAKSRRNGDQEIGNFPLSSAGESGEQEEQQEDEDLGGNMGINSNLVVEDSNPSSPNHSFGDDDNGNRKLSDDNNNVEGNQVRKQRSLRDNRHSNEMRRELMTPEVDRDSSGVRMWLNDLGLAKYAALFQIHGVDDEVLPLLTLEDLKDMGITEVGVRRKMYSSIQKLDRWFQ
ncbi:Sterile alpha motif domain-containing protein [Perilla frutescens var. hirtella]|uniref:Sterile alpha motif domain-containing protein n=1 Tax=Perilla frutescens var. hirtella TaxID=608512 RepID=A0AAD4ISW2_PERFH|nr:Sterile alpha motif domain-containing protein [Perilla frutescens var. hirtella]